MEEDLEWIVYRCFLPTVYQGAIISAPILISSIALRLCVHLRLSHFVIHAFATLIGVYMLWFFYSGGVLYFLTLCGLIYITLNVFEQQKGIIVAIISITYLLICEIYVASPSEWHQVRGSFLAMVMRMISLGFDLEVTDRGQKKNPRTQLPNVVEYTGYCLFPTTSIFGPFIVYNEHMKFLEPSPISITWLLCIAKAWTGSMMCLGVSSCVMPFLFNEPNWNKWLAAYAAAASFRYSHYFVSLLSQYGAISSGIGKTAIDNWSEYHVVNVFSIELPRSLGTVVTNWNLPMHIFLKNYVYKPARVTVGRFGAILATYLASALLHGLNFQLAAVLMSIGVYAYIEHIFRYKLSAKLSACILDRPCSSDCNHIHKKTCVWVFMLNGGFTLLAMFHLAYLGVMFGSQSPEEMHLELQGFSMMHTLRKWAHLNFLSHWIVLATYMIYLTM